MSVVDLISVRSVVGEESVLFVSVRVFVVTLCRDPGVWREETRIALARAHGSQNSYTKRDGRVGSISPVTRPRAAAVYRYVSEMCPKR